MTVAATLDDAHRLLREGRVDSAIAAYAALLKKRPDDWTTANRLGNLYVQTGQMDKAVEQFSHVAHCLIERNLLPKAAALYKKVMKVAPGDETTRGQLVDLALRQGFRVDAIGHLTAMAEQRRANGDDAGALEVQARIDSLRRPTEPGQVAPVPERDAGCHTGGARQLVLVILSETGDATGHILNLAKQLAAETGDATVMCADAMLEAARQGQTPDTNIAAVRSLAAWVPTQPEGSQWPAGCLERLARIDAAAALELPSEAKYALVDVAPDQAIGAEANTSRAPSPASPFTTAVAAAV